MTLVAFFRKIHIQLGKMMLETSERGGEEWWDKQGHKAIDVKIFIEP